MDQRFATMLLVASSLLLFCCSGSCLLYCYCYCVLLLFCQRCEMNLKISWEQSWVVIASANVAVVVAVAVINWLIFCVGKFCCKVKSVGFVSPFVVLPCGTGNSNSNSIFHVAFAFYYYILWYLCGYTQSNAKGIFGVPTACQINCFVISRPLWLSAFTFW